MREDIPNRFPIGNLSGSPELIKNIPKLFTSILVGLINLSHSSSVDRRSNCISSSLNFSNCLTIGNNVVSISTGETKVILSPFFDILLVYFASLVLSQYNFYAPNYYLSGIAYTGFTANPVFPNPNIKIGTE